MFGISAPFTDENIRLKEAYEQVAKVELGSLFYCETMFFPVFPASVPDPSDEFMIVVIGHLSSFSFSTILFIPLDSSFGEGGS